MTQTPEQIAARANEMQRAAAAQRHFAKCRRIRPSVIVGPHGHCLGGESQVVVTDHGHAVRAILEKNNG